VLLTALVLVERRVAAPLLPLRIVLDRDRGGSYLAVVLSAIAIFAVFLFITYYLQQNLHFSPVRAGLAFLPMVAMIMTSSIPERGAQRERNRLGDGQPQPAGGWLDRPRAALNDRDHRDPQPRLGPTAHSRTDRARHGPRLHHRPLCLGGDLALGALITGLLLRPKPRTPIPAGDRASERTSERALAR
jgi:hypothetical protein